MKPRTTTSGPPTVLLLLAATTLSCAGLQRTDLPEVSVVDLRLAAMTLLETTAEFTVRILNPSPEPLVLNGASFAIELGGLKVGRGLHDGPLEIPRLGSETVVVPVYLNNVALATRLRPLLATGRIDYELRGTLFRDSPLGLRRLKSRREGTLDFNPPEPSAPEPAAEDPGEKPAN